jgi:hypothetical protein
MLFAAFVVFSLTGMAFGWLRMRRLRRILAEHEQNG